MEASIKRTAAWIIIVFSLFGGVSSSANTPQMVLQFGLGNYSFAAMSPDGAYMATASGGGVALSNPKNGVIRAYLIPPLAKTLIPSGIRSAVFSPDSRLLALGDYDNRITIWNTRTETFIRAMEIPGPEDRVNSLQFDRTGKRLMASLYASAGPVMVFNVATGKPLSQWYPTLQGQHARTESADLSADGKRIVTFSVLETEGHPHQSSELVESAMQMYDAQTGKILWQKDMNPPNPDYYAHFVLGDAEILLAADNTAIICRASDGKTLTSWPLKDPMNYFSVSPDGKTAVMVGYGGSDVYSIPDGHLVKRFFDDGEPVDAFYQPNGQLILQTYHFPLVILAARTLRQLWMLPKLASRSATAIAASPDGQTYAVIAELDGGGPMGPRPPSVLLLFNAKTGRLRRQIELGQLWTDSLAFSPDSKRIVCETEVGWSIFDVATGDVISKIYLSKIDAFRQPLSVWTGPVKYSADGKDLFASGSENTLVFRSAMTGDVLKTLTFGPEKRVDQYALSPDGKMLAATVWNQINSQHNFTDVEIWDVAQRKRIQILPLSQKTLPKRLGSYPLLQFSPDGKTLVVGHYGPDARPDFEFVEGTLDLYSIPEGIKRATIPDFARQQVAFSPDSKTLFTASGVAWDVQTGHALWRTAPPHNSTGKMIALSVNRSGQGNIITSYFQDLIIWDAKTGHKKATIYLLPFKESELGRNVKWLTVTANGYYCGAPGVSHWVRWRNGTTMLPAGALDAQRNSPDHVQQALKEH